MKKHGKQAGAELWQAQAQASWSSLREAFIRKNRKQAGAELWQAQVKLEVIVEVVIVVKMWIQLLAWVMLNLTQAEDKLEIELELDIKIWKYEKYDENY